MPRKKTPAQLDREIAAVVPEVRTAAQHVAAINDAIYKTKDPSALIAAVKAANKHRGLMKRLARKEVKGRSAFVDSAGNYDHSMYELANLLVDAKQRIKNIRKQEKKPTASRSHSKKKAQKRYRLTVAGPTGRYTYSEFTGTEPEAIARARSEIDYGAVHVIVDTDVDHLNRTSPTRVTELRKK